MQRDPQPRATQPRPQRLDERQRVVGTPLREAIERGAGQRAQPHGLARRHRRQRRHRREHVHLADQAAGREIGQRSRTVAAIEERDAEHALDHDPQLVGDLVLPNHGLAGPERHDLHLGDQLAQRLVRQRRNESTARSAATSSK